MVATSTQAVHAEDELRFRGWGVVAPPGSDKVGEYLPRITPPAVVTLQERVCSYPWPCQQALKVMLCESTNRPWVNNGSSIGLFQIRYPSHMDKVGSSDELYDPDTNIRVAYQIWSEQGWDPWSCSP